MSVFDCIKRLADRRGKSLQSVAIDLGFSDNLFYRWKESNPKAADLEKVADYFHVSIDYLMGREESMEPQKVDLTEVSATENWDEWLSAGGKPLTDRDKEVLKALFGDKLKG